MLREDNGKCAQFAFTIDPRNQIPDTQIARVPIGWSGGGWGQFAKIMAETKIPSGRVVTATVMTIIDQEKEGGLIREVKYRDLENQKCSDLVDGVIYINSSHALNSSVFGRTQDDYARAVEGDRTAQYRLCSIITEQSVFRLADDMYLSNKLTLGAAPVTSVREFVDSKTYEFAPRLLKILVTAP